MIGTNCNSVKVPAKHHNYTFDTIQTKSMRLAGETCLPDLYFSGCQRVFISGANQYTADWFWDSISENFLWEKFDSLKYLYRVGLGASLKPLNLRGYLASFDSFDRLRKPLREAFQGLLSVTPPLVSHSASQRHFTPNFTKTTLKTSNFTKKG